MLNAQTSRAYEAHKLSDIDFGDIRRQCAAGLNLGKIGRGLVRRGRGEDYLALSDATALGEVAARWNAALNGAKLNVVAARRWGAFHVEALARFVNWALELDIMPELYLRGLIERMAALPRPNALRSAGYRRLWDCWVAQEGRKATSAASLEARLGGGPLDALSWCRDGLRSGQELCEDTQRRLNISRETACYLEQAALHPAFLCAQPSMVALFKARDGSLAPSTALRMEDGFEELAKPGVVAALVREGWLA